MARPAWAGPVPAVDGGERRCVLKPGGGLSRPLQRSLSERAFYRAEEVYGLGTQC